MYGAPLHGIEQFSNASYDVQLDLAVLDLFYLRRSEVLQVFIDNPFCLETPYGFYQNPSDNLV